MADYSDDDEYVIGYQATDAPPPAQRPPQQQQRLGSRPERCYHLAARLEELGNEEQRQVWGRVERWGVGW